MIVCDVFSGTNNGTTVSCRNFVQQLRLRGHEVRVITTGEPGEGLYIVPGYTHNLAATIASWNGIVFGKADDAVIQRALDGADIVHVYMPFPLAKRVRKLASVRHIPCTAAFHVQPEDVTYNLGLDKCSCLANQIYKWVRDYFYTDYTHIHCPSRFIANELERTGYKAKLHVISNGVNEIFRYNPIPKIPQLKGKFCILMVGRLSKEKRQDVLIKACCLSKYANSIQLILAGHGPKEEKFRRMARKLPNPAIFGFYPQTELANLMNMCDLYVHASDVEIEAISCIEAFACGLVPVIANSRISATTQFALCEQSLFKAGNPKDCAAKIDYWIEHPEEKKRMAQQYVAASEQYRLGSCIDSMVSMFQEAIRENAQYLCLFKTVPISARLESGQNKLECNAYRRLRRRRIRFPFPASGPLFSAKGE